MHYNDEQRPDPDRRSASELAFKASKASKLWCDHVAIACDCLFASFFHEHSEASEELSLW